MSCFQPLRGFQRSPGAPLLFGVPTGAARVVEVSCGQCIGCRLERARQMAVRCVHESKMHERNSFVTLTYDDEHLPTDLCLRYEDFQLFLKRLRERVGKVRYYVCGEYGSVTSRPHYHALLFGFSPVDKVFLSTSKRGDRLYRSAFVESVWGNGFASLGEVTFESAGYCARYVLKKELNGETDQSIIDVETGEVIKRPKEFSRMSLKPGLGAGFFEAFAGDMYPSDRVVVRGVRQRVPRYYDDLLSRHSPVYLAELKAKRLAKADEFYEDTMPYRMRAKEVVKKAAIKSLKRRL